MTPVAATGRMSGVIVTDSKNMDATSHLRDDAGSEAPPADPPDAPSGAHAVVRTATPARRRKGRNLPAAIAVGLSLGAVLVGSLFVDRHVFVGLVAVTVGVATWELAGALRRSAGIRISLLPVLAGGQAIVWLSWPFGRNGMAVAFMLTVLACVAWRFAGGVRGFVRDMTASVFVTVYIPLFGAFGAMLVTPPDGAWRALTLVVVVACSDVGGYAAGVRFGRRPMASSISPGKTWEGFIGSVVLAVIGGTAMITFTPLSAPWWTGPLFGAAMALTATSGDLMESLIKRDLGIKDMGNLLPGHGGLMDRLDSLLPSAVACWLMLSVIAPV